MATSRVSIKDITLRAAASHSTVSRALSDSARLRAETTNRIQPRIRELGDSPSALARVPVRGRTLTIGAIVTSSRVGTFHQENLNRLAAPRVLVNGHSQLGEEYPFGAGPAILEDLVAVGSGDIPLAGYVRPSLTIMGQPTTQMGARALQMALDVRPEGDSEQSAVSDVVVQGELVVRESSITLQEG